MKKIFLLSILFLSHHYVSYSRQWLVLLADAADNNSLTGHAYVTFIKDNPVLKQNVVIGCWGFYPKKDRGVFSYVESEFRNDLAREKDVSLVIEVTEAEFEACLAVKDEWENRKYTLTVQNCLHFLKAIATKIQKIVQPKDALPQIMPAKYLADLKAVNKDIDVRGIVGGLPTADLSTTWQQYRAPDTDFSIEYPNSWVFAENSKEAKVFITQNLNNDHKAYDAAIAVFIMPIKGDTSVNFLWNTMVAQLRNVPGVKVLKMEKKKNNDFEGIWVDYTFRDARNKASAHWIGWVVINGGQYYTVRYMSYTSFDALYLGDGIRILNSFDVSPINIKVSETASAVERTNPKKIDNSGKSDTGKTSPGILFTKEYTGGETPDDLGKLMLKAFVNNDPALWARLIHPTLEDKRENAMEWRDAIIKQFNDVRKNFAARGLSNWSDVKFSRVTYQECDQCASANQKWLRELVVEFWYQDKEFLGGLVMSPSYTYKGKFFIAGLVEGGFERVQRIR